MINFKETFSAVSMRNSFRTVMAFVSHFDIELHHMDIKTMFNDDIDETIYMVQSKNLVCEDAKKLVYKLMKFIYRLK